MTKKIISRIDIILILLTAIAVFFWLNTTDPNNKVQSLDLTNSQPKAPHKIESQHNSQHNIAKLSALPLNNAANKTAPQNTPVTKPPITLISRIYQLNQTAPEQAAILLDQAELPEQFALSLSLINNWGLTSPEIALNWLQTQSNKFSESEYQLLMRSVLKNYAKQQPDYVFYQLQHLTTEQIWPDIVFEIALAWGDKNPYEALTWLDDLTTSPLKFEDIVGAHVAVLEKYKKQDPIAARNWVNDINNPKLSASINHYLDL
ncbi:hypothetical protein [Algibacillus agarilyticus]|uniref:hypothetical protein n=1 Tax=Algibacillus agarilyticus TaxID=2234133 RepID=UPI000DD0634A|nr:hypothetical protein [Algibacillus agarilyticus]